MSQYIDKWTYDTLADMGDTVKHMRLDVRDDNDVIWGTGVGLGWTPTLQIRKSGDAAIVATATGAWEDATEGAALFQIGNESTMTFVSPTTTLVPAVATPAVPNSRINYEGQLVMVDAGMTHRGIPSGEWFAFSVERWP